MSASGERVVEARVACCGDGQMDGGLAGSREVAIMAVVGAVLVSASSARGGEIRRRPKVQAG